MRAKREHRLLYERCDLYGVDPKHEEDCWKVINYSAGNESGAYPIVANHIPFRQAMPMVSGISQEEYDRKIAEFENETPEQEAQWWKDLENRSKDNEWRREDDH